jgi:hypothetical protein
VGIRRSLRGPTMLRAGFLVIAPSRHRNRKKERKVASFRPDVVAEAFRA